MPPSPIGRPENPPLSRRSFPSELPDQTEQTLLQIFRLMDPHKALDDSYYLYAVRKIEDKRASGQVFAESLKRGVSELKLQRRWAQLSDLNRQATLKEIEETPFFQRIRTEFVVAFSGNPMVWQFLGYEGPNTVMEGFPELPFGGYKQRGSGRESGQYGFDEYSEFKGVIMDLEKRAFWWKPPGN